MVKAEDTAIEQEFDRQVAGLLSKGYPAAANVNEKEFIALVDPLKNNLSALPHTTIDIDAGTLPFVIVITHDLIPADIMMGKVEREGKPGITKLFPHTPTDFSVIEAVQLPASKAYLLLDIDRGKKSINVRPEDARITIQKEGRSPLTIDEGIALVTHYPDFLMKNNCFSLLASRHPGDQRVPAIWINGAKQPNLGWCWDRNPHTWLGSASCGSRI